MATKRLTDFDGNISEMTLGALIEGDGTTSIATEGYYLVNSTAASTDLPTGSTVGYPVYLTTSTTPAVGDDVYPMTFTKACDIQGGNITMAKDEYDTTTLCDSIKVYETGRADINGSLNGVTTAGSDFSKELTNKFFTVATQSADYSMVTISEASNGILYLQIAINQSSTSGEPEQYYLLPIAITGSEAGVTVGSAQTFSANFRVTTDGDRGVLPVFFELEQPVA